MLKLSFNPFPVLTSERLILRNLCTSDAEKLFELRTNPEVNKYLDRPPTEGIEAIYAFIEKIDKAISENKSIYWVLSLRNSGEVIGTICLWNILEEESCGETGFELLPAFHGNGYMGEALDAVLNYGFKTMKLNSIHTYTHRENERSVALLKKNNFIRNLSAEKKINRNAEPFAVVYTKYQ